MINVFLKTELWKIYGKKVFGVLFLFVFIMGMMYMYFINLAVLKTAERKHNLSKLSEIRREFQELEMDYINKLNKLNISYAETLGFVESDPVGYIHTQKALVQGYDYGKDFR
ncbi:MAG: hypothetical protein ABII97_03405 [Patescibacteria group bacterium]